MITVISVVKYNSKHSLYTFFYNRRETDTSGNIWGLIYCTLVLSTLNDKVIMFIMTTIKKRVNSELCVREQFESSMGMVNSTTTNEISG